MNPTIERRYGVDSVLFRSKPIGDRSIGTLKGCACRFRCLSDDLGGFRERVLPGAFTGVLRDGHDVRALINHDPSKILGRTASGTLFLNENGEGLQCAVNLPDVSYANDLFTSISRGDISQMSFAFQVGDQTWTDEPMESDDPLYDPTQRDQIRKIRTIHSVSRLDDISFVAYPAYPQTTASAHYSSARDPVIAHSIGELWPEGQPTEVRSHMLDVVNRSTHEARRNIWNMFL